MDKEKPTAMVPSWRLAEEAERRRALEARVAWLERENAVLRAAVTDLGGDVDALILKLN